MTGNEITEMEKELWKKVFRVNNSTKECIKRFYALKEKCESEINTMNAPSRESVNELVSIQESLRRFKIVLLLCEVRLIMLNSNFKYN